MNIYGNNFLSSRDARLLNILLISAGIFFLVWTLSIWISTSNVPSGVARQDKEMTPKYEKQRLLRMSAYNQISTKDLFSPTRTKYVAPRTAVAKPVVRAAAPSKAPSLKLLGTVILDNGHAAVMSVQGMEDETRSYKEGESIGGFRIDTITDNSVSLSRGSERLVVLMNEKPGTTPGTAPKVRSGSTGSQKKARVISPRWLAR